MTASQTSSGVKTAAELRRAFLDFFASRDHTIVPSSPLVPVGDKTMLFNTAGMVQFKPYYTSKGEVPYTRATSAQKCIRLSDLENVGNTPRHCTFFEMLGNFSFGSKEKGAYFKEEAIALAWEFVTKVLALPKDKIYVSIFAGEGNMPRDDEAAELWKKVGFPAERIVALGRADNFWGPAGGQGACGPSSEIYYDLGEKRPKGMADDVFWGESPGDEGDRFTEFWNLVFPQFDAAADGQLTNLPRPGIDTGLGLDRLAMIMQGKRSIFETDMFAPLLEQVMEQAEPARASEHNATRDARIIADHVRALTFAIGEGALPGNEGAGYVLRRLLRRAVTRGRSSQGLGITAPLLSRLSGRAIEMFGDHYKELPEHRERIVRVLETEEAGFVQTFEAGLTRLEQLMSSGAKRLSGEDVFGLHDTYGFPAELTEEIAAERGIQVDRDGFERAMDQQRERARAASKFGGKEDVARKPWNEVTSGADSAFLGYESLEAAGLTLRRWREGEKSTLELVLDRTPCYAESGGQVADPGTITGGGAQAKLVHVYKEDEHIVHRVKLGKDDRDKLIAAGQDGQLTAQVPPSHRDPTMRHHTATHLLHAALRHVLGTHVRQAGSLVAPDRLRFDYTHFEHPTPEQLEQIERMVNEWVLRNRPVTWEVMPIDRARELGAMALFGEKYGAEVRMVSVEGVEAASIPVSRELCGGIHVGRTGDIGAFTLVGDSAIASGVRRIEALCGHEALHHLREQKALLAESAAVLQAKPAALPKQIEKLRTENERLKKAQADLQAGGLADEMAKLVGAAQEAPQGRWIVAEIASGADVNAVREAADGLRGELRRGAAVLALRGEGKLTFLAAVTDDLVSEKRLRADELVRAVAKIAGGSGGGKPHLALAGAKQPEKLGSALDEARRLLETALAS